MPKFSVPFCSGEPNRNPVSVVKMIIISTTTIIIVITGCTVLAGVFACLLFMITVYSYIMESTFVSGGERAGN